MGKAALLWFCLLTGCTPIVGVDRPWVHTLVLHGVRHVDEQQLRRSLTTQPSSSLPLSRRQPFDPLAFRLDALRVEHHYQARGYFDARVVSSSVRPAQRKNGVDLTLEVDEGPASKLRTVKLAGIDTLGDDAKVLARNFDLERGQIFDHTRFVAETNEVRARLSGAAYPWAHVDGQVVVDRDRHLADVTLSITPGAQATLGQVEVLGSQSVPARLLIRHAGLDRAEPFTSDLLSRAHSKLYNLGLYSSVKLDYRPSASTPHQADLSVTVQEAPAHEWRLGAGLSFDLSRTEVRGRILYGQNHLFGGLRTLRLRFEPAYVALPAFWNPLRQGPAATAEARFTQLDLIRAPDELRATVGYDLGVEYAFQYHGPRLELAYSLRFFRDRLQIGIAYDFTYLLFFNTDPAFLLDPADAARRFGYVNPYRLAWWYQEIALDLRDRPVEARRGGYFALRFEEGGIYAGGAFTYEKIVAEARGYLPLGGRVVIAGRTLFGQILAHGDLGSPTTRRFYLGGRDSHRGFNYNRLSPQTPSGLAGAPSIPIGGDQSLLTQVELRVRAARLFGYWLEVASFLDFGEVADRIDPTQLHYAVGGGLRYQTIIGTLRADVGVRLNRLAAMEADGTPNPDPGDRVTFHLSIGEPF